MRVLRKVVSNIVISLVGQAITWVSTILLTAAYGRFLGDTRFGELYFAITFVALIGFPIEFGFNLQLTRDVAQKPEEALRYLTNTLLLKLLLWLPFYAVLIALSWLLGYPPDERLLIGICGITLFSTSVANTFAGLHSAFERTYFSATGSIFERVIDAVAGILLLKFGAGVEAMALVLMTGSLVNTLWQGAWCFGKVGFFQRPSRSFMASLFKSSLPFLVYGVLGVIYYRVDTVMLSLMTNDTVVGWYGAAYRLFDTLLFLPSLVISAIIYPLFAKLTLHSEQQLKLAIEKTMNFVLFCGIPIATFLAVAAPQIIGFLYHNPDFNHSILTLQALAPGLIFLYANSVLAAILLSTHRERKMLILALSALVFNLTVNSILIPLFAQLGTALTTSATELLLLIISLLLVPRKLLPVKSLLSALRICFAAGVMGACLWWLQNNTLLLLLPIALFVYIVVALLCKALPLADLRIIYASMRDRKKRAPVALSEPDQNQIALLSRINTSPLPSINIMVAFDDSVDLSRDILVTMDTLPLPSLDFLPDLNTIPTVAASRERNTDEIEDDVATYATQHLAAEYPLPPPPSVKAALLGEKVEDTDATVPRISSVSLLRSERSKSR
ncbi:MAG TPA: flippase [Ktedonobacteraceae bacterium]